jgi:hypothetical protein
MSSTILCDGCHAVPLNAADSSVVRSLRGGKDCDSGLEEGDIKPHTYPVDPEPTTLRKHPALLTERNQLHERSKLLDGVTEGLLLMESLGAYTRKCLFVYSFVYLLNAGRTGNPSNQSGERHVRLSESVPIPPGMRRRMEAKAVESKEDHDRRSCLKMWPKTSVLFTSEQNCKSSRMGECHGSSQESHGPLPRVV